MKNALIAKSGEFALHDIDTNTFNKLVSENDNITYVDEKMFRDIGRAIFVLNERFNVHKIVKKLYDESLKSIEEGAQIDWGTTELMAYGTLLAEG